MSHSSRLNSARLEALEPRRLLAAQTPFLGAPFSVGAGTTIVQAEDFDNGGEGVAYHDVDAANLGRAPYRSGGVDIGTTTHAGGGGFAVGYVKAGEWLEYTLDVAREGGYNLVALVATIGTGGRYHIEINGVDVTGSRPVPDTNGWENWSEAGDFVNLPAGRSVMRVVMETNGTRGNVGNFDYFKIFHVPPGLPPAGQGPYLEAPFAIDAHAPTRITMSLFDNGGEGVAYHDVDAVNSGKEVRVTGVDIQASTDPTSGYNLGWTKAGEWVEYSVDIAQGGAYDLDFRLANTGNNGKFHVEIDGSDVTGQLTMPNTGGYQAWTTITKTGANLPAGKHVLRLKMDANSSNGSVGNFNWIEITPGSPVTHTTTLTNTVAAFVRDGQFIDTNFGGDPQLEVKNSTLGYNREAYLLFDLSPLTTISSAKLRVWGRLSDATLASADMDVFRSGDVTWREDEITWNNKSAATTQIASGTVSGTAGQWYEFDVTGYIQQAATPQGQETASIVLKSKTFSSGPLILFNSDDASNAPELVVTS